VAVHAVAATRSDSIVVDGISDDSGRFALAQLPPGKVTVVAQHHTLGLATRDAEVKSGEGIQVSLVLGETGRITGTVLDDNGARSDGGEVALGTPTASGSGAADDAGHYAVDGLPAGRYIIGGWQEKARAAWRMDGGRERGVDIAAGETKVVDLKVPVGSA